MMPKSYRAAFGGPHRDERRDAGACASSPAPTRSSVGDTLLTAANPGRTRIRAVPPARSEAAGARAAGVGRARARRGRRRHHAGDGCCGSRCTAPRARIMAEAHERALQALSRRGRLRSLSPRRGSIFPPTTISVSAIRRSERRPRWKRSREASPRRCGRLAASARE